MGAVLLGLQVYRRQIFACPETRGDRPWPVRQADNRIKVLLPIRSYWKEWLSWTVDRILW